MRIDVLTLFPELFDSFLSTSIVGRARECGIIEVACTNYRDFCQDKRRTVDDRPFGGGAGMILMCEPVVTAVEGVTARHPEPATVLMLSPQGARLEQPLVADLAKRPRLMLLCGRYEGFDDRIRVGLGAIEVSIGDYVLSGGEVPAMVLIDAVTRLLPGALGDEQSPEDESFSRGMLEYPQYTRPREFRGLSVPEVLLSGDHAEIEKWRRRQAMERTRTQRPDLMRP